MAKEGRSPSESLPRRVYAFCREHRLFREGDRVIVAVSGGADSVALLQILYLSPFRLHLVVAHLNHRLRGGASDADEEFVRGVSQRLNLPFFSRSADVRSLAETDHLSLEDAGRAARYGFLLSLKNELSADRIALAHHADDQAETLLIRLLRGSGVRGLAGMPPLDPRGIVRPFLGVTRDEIRGYLSAIGVSWREDESNADTALSLRNRVRHHLLPILQEYNPRIVQRLVVTASLLSADDRCIQEEALRLFDRIARVDGARVTIPWEKLIHHPLAVVRRVIRHAHSLLSGSAYPLPHDPVEDCISRGGGGGRIPLPGGVIFESSGGVISFCSGGAPEPLPELTVPGEGRYPLGDGRIVKVLPGHRPTGEGGVDLLVVPLDRFPFPWRVRGRRPGDRIHRAGVGEQKIKKLMQDRRIPRWERDSIPLFESGGVIFWVPGVASTGAEGEGPFVTVTLLSG